MKKVLFYIALSSVCFGGIAQSTDSQQEKNELQIEALKQRLDGLLSDSKKNEKSISQVEKNKQKVEELRRRLDAISVGEGVEDNLNCDSLSPRLYRIEVKLDSILVDFGEVKQQQAELLLRDCNSSSPNDSLFLLINEMKAAIATLESNQQDAFEKQNEIEMMRIAHLAKRKELHQFMEKENVSFQKLDEFNTNRWNYYVVIGTFEDMNYAKFLQKVYQRDFKVETKIQKNNIDNYFVGWTNQVYSKEETQQEIDRINSSIDNTYLEDGAWLYHTPK